MKIAVIGTGYVGLVTGTWLAQAGRTVSCVDIDAAKVAETQAGHIPIFEPGLSEIFQQVLAANKLTVTTEVAAGIADTALATTQDADALLITTEWQEFRTPDFATLKSALKTPTIFDGCNLYDPTTLINQGYYYDSIGRPNLAVEA